MTNSPPLWPWQERGLNRVIELIETGHTAICRSLFTGGGKTREQAELARWAQAKGWRVLIYVNQRALTAQTGASFATAGLVPGFLAAGFDGPLSDIRVCSAQTVRRRQGANPPEADLVLIDECHRRDFDYLLEHYRERGTPVVGYSATPVGLAGKYQVMVLEGTKAEARAIGALVRCDVFSPSEPDMKGVRFTKEDEYNQKEAAKRIVQCEVFADAILHWFRLNPEQKPTVLWAPGVPESRGFVAQLLDPSLRPESCRLLPPVTAAHIDGDTPLDERDRIARASAAGDIKIVSSFGVLREGVDWPWISHGILIQPCGALSTYLQIVGRILRGHPGKELAILQEHAGAFHRHGSPNLDRDWDLTDTNKSIARAQKARREAGQETEPICCPRCHAVRKGGGKCWSCGYEHTRSVRMVRTINGELKKQIGNVTKKKKVQNESQKVWTGCLFAAAARGMTCRQAWGLFFQKTGKPPTPDCRPMLPEGDLRWMRRVADVFPGFARKKVLA